MIMTLCAVVTVCVGCGTQTVRNIDSQADAILRNMSETLDSAEAFSFEAEGIMDEVLETGQLVQISRRSNILAIRPDKLHVDTEGDDVSRSAWYDGRTVTVLDRRAKAYASIKVPNTIERMLDFAVEKYGLTIPVSDLLFSNSYEGFIAGVRTGQYVGLYEADGSKCHHLAFQADAIDWQIWIAQGEHPYPCRYVITSTFIAGGPQYSIQTRNWKTGKQVAATDFSFRNMTNAAQMSTLSATGSNSFPKLVTRSRSRASLPS